jgi:plasmid stability protein
MAQLIVRSVESAVVDGLQRRARRNRRSLEDEVRLKPEPVASPDGTAEGVPFPFSGPAPATREVL